MVDKWWHLFPDGVPPDTRRLLLGKGLRAFTDGLVSIVLPVYLLRLGYSAFGVGAIVTSTLLGSALLTLSIGLFAHRFPGRKLLLAACVLMAATALGQAEASFFAGLAQGPKSDRRRRPSPGGWGMPHRTKRHRPGVALWAASIGPGPRWG